MAKEEVFVLWKTRFSATKDIDDHDIYIYIYDHDPHTHNWVLGLDL